MRTFLASDNEYAIILEDVASFMFMPFWVKSIDQIINEANNTYPSPESLSSSSTCGKFSNNSEKYSNNCGFKNDTKFFTGASSSSGWDLITLHLFCIMGGFDGLDNCRKKLCYS